MLQQDEAAEFLADLRDRPAAMHAVGAIAFFLGGGLLSLHRHWSSPPEVVLNTVAAWWMFEGAGMLADPKRMRKLFAGTASSKQVQLAAVTGTLLGVYLLIFGLFGNVG
jgi:hypothetical protein